MKKYLIFGVILALVLFFSIPSMIFAESPPPTDTVDEADNPEDWSDNATVIDDVAGNTPIQVKDLDYSDHPDHETTDIGDTNNGEVFDVYCLDSTGPICEGDLYDVADNDPMGDGKPFIVTDITSNDFYTNNFDGFDPDGAGGPLDTINLSDPTDKDEIANLAEQAVLLLAENSTGLCVPNAAELEQKAVWSFTDNGGTGTTSGKIADALTAIVKANNDDDLTNDIDPDSINTIEVILEDGAVDTTPVVPADGQIVTVKMEDPLVPGMTDQDKPVFLYLLPGSYNVSFAPDSLVTETIANMVDTPDLVDVGDTDGVATSYYYFYPWAGVDYNAVDPTFPDDGVAGNNPDIMVVKIGAWVDIDKDKCLDTVGLPYDKKDQDAFKLEYVNDEDPLDETPPEFPVCIDNSTLPGGAVLNPIVEKDPWCGPDYEKNLWEKPESYCFLWWRFYDPQRLCVKASEDPYDDATQYSIYSTAGANGSINNEGMLMLLTAGRNYASIPTPDGGFIIQDVTDVDISQGAISPYNIINISKPAIINAQFQTAPSGGGTPTITTTTGAAGGVEVAALTTGVIQVLAFTGISPVISISGFSTIAGGLALVVMSLVKKIRRR